MDDANNFNQIFLEAKKESAQDFNCENRYVSHGKMGTI
jgi:hypothetical protein